MTSKDIAHEILATEEKFEKEQPQNTSNVILHTDKVDRVLKEP